jgi:hypothetical protein
MVEFSFVRWLKFPLQIPGQGPKQLSVDWRCKDSVPFTVFKLPVSGIFGNYSINEPLTILFPHSRTISTLISEYFSKTCLSTFYLY